jgi:site-specific recombinase XerD
MTAMLTLMAYAGARCCEVADLNTEDVMEHLDIASVILHGKGGKDRVVPMNGLLIDALHGHGLPMRGPVFRAQDGRRLGAWKVSHLVRHHLHVTCGVEASAHQLRHWFCTKAYVESGFDLRMVQELAGHESPNTTAGYTFVAQARAAEVVRRLHAA